LERGEGSGTERDRERKGSGEERGGQEVWGVVVESEGEIGAFRGGGWGEEWGKGSEVRTLKIVWGKVELIGQGIERGGCGGG